MRARWLIRLAFPALIAMTAALTQPPPARWYKGNLHTHTLNSDGDSTPHEVATWYREHGYQFLVLTDHNYLTGVEGLNSIHAARDKFLLIPGEEVTSTAGKAPIHVNALNLGQLVSPARGTGVAEVIQGNVDAIRAAKALPSVNHPNFGWAITADVLLRVKNLGLFEVYNGHPTVNNDGGGGAQSLDEMWDVLLTAGQRIQGIAVDDAHYFKKLGSEFSNPGKGWVNVRATSLSPESIMGAIEAGQFYSSTGVNLSDIQMAGGEYRITIAPRPTERFTTYFVGAGGKVLSKSLDATPTYRVVGGEKYIRARVESSFGSRAWTQPVFLADGGR